MTIPDDMTAIVADATADDAVSRLRVARVPVPRPGRGEVLVKMHAAPCNPADLMYLQGRYGIDRPLPATPGFEGAGVVVASGGGMLGRWLLGRRVACGGHDCSGTWAEYCVAKASACLPLAKALTFEQGAAALANPTTALSLVQVMRRGGHRAFVQTAAAGQLGRMIFAAARDRGLVGIHVVRRAEQAETLRALGAEHVLVSTDPDFDRELAARVNQLGATVALDAVAGDMTGRLLRALPEHGEVIVYGALSGTPSGAIDPMALAFGHKRIVGFEIAGYLKELGLWRSFRLASEAQRRVRAGAFTTEIADRVAFADAPARLGAYVGRMTDGKVLLTP
jgi:NADPH:quinone reductase